MTRSGTPTQNRTPLNSSTSVGSSNDNGYKAALRGASLAFQNTGSKQSQGPIPPQARKIDNGALIAATSTSHQHGLGPPRSPPRAQSPGISRQATGGSSRNTGTSGDATEHGSVAQRLQQPLQQTLQQQGHATTPLLMPPGKQTVPAPKSPSFIAATLAASRSGSPSSRQPVQPRPYSQQTAKRQEGGNTGTYSAATSVTSLDLATDTTSLPPANTLISMFENKDGDIDPVKKQLFASNSNKLLITKPKPEPKPKPRPDTPSTGSSPVTKPTVSPSRSRQESAPARKRPGSPPASAKEPARERPETQKEPAVVESKRLPPTPPPPRSTKNDDDEILSSTAMSPRRKSRASTPPRPTAGPNTVILSPQPRRVSSQKIISHKPGDAATIASSQPKAPPPAVKPKPQRRASVHYIEKSPALPKQPVRPIVLAEKERRRPVSSSSDDSFVSASSAPWPQPGPTRRPASAQSTPARSQGRRGLPPPPPPPQRHQQQQHPRQQNADIPLSALTNAIVAGSLASSRATPARTASSTAAAAARRPPTPPSRRQTPRMRHTLRQPPSARSDDEGATAAAAARARQRRHHHRKKPFGRGGKHAHHEGQRRRWREEITPRERKRYEGVWASNRGLLPDRDPTKTTTTTTATKGDDGGGGGGGGDDLVTNVVVRDIWARSRLPDDELAEVWDLVAAPADSGSGRGRDRALDRAQFVVGMWLIDQRLRGRKIPRKVSDSVWGSARRGDVRVRVVGK